VSIKAEGHCHSNQNNDEYEHPGNISQNGLISNATRFAVSPGSVQSARLQIENVW